MNLYTRLVSQELCKFTATMERIERRKKTILRAEEMARKINKSGIAARVDADSNQFPVIVLQIPIDRLEYTYVFTGGVARVLGHAVVANGEEFIILPVAEETEFSGQRLLIEAI